MCCHWYGVLFLCLLDVEIKGQFINATINLRCEASSSEEARRGLHCFEVPFWHQRPGGSTRTSRGCGGAGRTWRSAGTPASRADPGASRRAGGAAAAAAALNASSSEEARRGSHCFEVPFWHQRPVRLGAHLARLQRRWPDVALGRHDRERAPTQELAKETEAPPPRVALNVEVSRYMEAVLTPFLDTYYGSIRSILRQLSTKMRAISEDENKAAERLKESMHKEMNELADQLELPAMCDEERRRARTLSSGHVARVHSCVVGARAATDEMAGYIEEMIRVTRREMRRSVVQAGAGGGKINVTVADEDVVASMRKLSQASVALGFELDLSLTNARRHSEQSCLRLARCAARARRDAARDAAQLAEEMHQCVYA